MPFARKKPVTIEYFRYGYDEKPNWFYSVVQKIIHSKEICEIKTLEGVMIGNKGDYIIKGVKGEIYPIKPDIFEATYDFPV